MQEFYLIKPLSIGYSDSEVEKFIGQIIIAEKFTHNGLNLETQENWSKTAFCSHGHWFDIENVEVLEKVFIGEKMETTNISQMFKGCKKITIEY